MEKYITYRLYLGRAIPGNRNTGISDEMLASFLNKHVNPVADGYTVLTGLGHWKGQNEKCAILEIKLPFTGFSEKFGAPGFIVNIAEEYKNQFSQESVLIDMTPSFCDFV